MNRADRDLLASGLGAGACIAALVTFQTFDQALDQAMRDRVGAVGSIWSGAFAIWVVSTIGALEASWRRGVVALPSTLLALAKPVVFFMAVGGLGLD